MHFILISTMLFACTDVQYVPHT